jgi:hypothetical protein
MLLRPGEHRVVIGHARFYLPGAAFKRTRAGFCDRAFGYFRSGGGAGGVGRKSVDSERTEMGISVSLLLIAAGAILAWAVNADVSGLEIQTIGVILLVVGILGLILSVIFWSSWGGFGGAGSGSNSTTVVTDRVERDRVAQ